MKISHALQSLIQLGLGVLWVAGTAPQALAQSNWAADASNTPAVTVAALAPSAVSPAATGGMIGMEGASARGTALPGLPSSNAADAARTPGVAFSDMGQGTGPVAPLGPKSDGGPLAPNQFQRFVASASGQALPLYGYNLFNGNNFNSLTNVPVPANYVLGPGDDIDLKLWGSIDTAIRLTVDRNGQITIPKVGPVTVAGIRADQLEKQLKAQVGRVFNNFELNATLGRLRSIQVYVVGQARKPGAYTVSGLSTLISTLFESGGPAATGSMRQIQLVRDGKTITTLDLYAFIHSGKTAADAQLLPGDVIVIPPAGPRVAMLGALDTPAVYELKSPEEPLQAVLGYSGGLNVLTTPHKALVERIDPANGRAPRSVQERSLNAAGLQTTVRNGDMVTLLPIAAQFSNAVTLRGNVAAPLRYSFKPGMRVSDLIPEPAALIQGDYYTRKNNMVQFESGKNISVDRVAGDVKNLLEEINWDYAAIERLDAKEVKTVLIPFNLGKAIKDKDPANNLQLQPGDVVTIFGVSDLPVPIEKRNQFVRLAGEVMVPGVYQIAPGETLPDVVKRAGGLSRNSFLYATVLTRESTRLQQQANLDKATRQLESDISSQSARLAQNASDSEKNSQQAQAAAQKVLLDRVRNLKASGRISLEMEPTDPVMPPLALEDGDSILIPHKPSFVGVFGAVLSETSFIHKASHTVGDYLEKAGPTREADLEAVLLIRADGSVLSNKAQRSWLGFGHGAFLRTPMYPGDSLFVPELVDRRTAYTQFIQGAKDWTQLFYQFGLGAAGLKTLRN
ncbi:SLBB domain-containing protein [Limnohabitans sp. DM1]|uniref:polysaccharide biosynthesis/export family protein n=1 Tax=Limnohabitans sp. DM1 TaxID=1597955 RepID=UPI000AEC40B4|nr:SLBB domain-containing protein [Limnohabitans sp. DM1]